MIKVDEVGVYYIVRGVVGKNEVYSLVVALNVDDSIKTIKEIYPDIIVELILSIDDLFAYSDYINNSTSKMFELKMNKESVGIADIHPVDFKSNESDDVLDKGLFYITKEEFIVLLSSALKNFADKNPELFISKQVFDKCNNS